MCSFLNSFSMAVSYHESKYRVRPARPHWVRGYVLSRSVPILTWTKTSVRFPSAGLETFNSRLNVEEVFWEIAFDFKERRQYVNRMIAAFERRMTFLPGEIAIEVRIRLEAQRGIPSGAQAKIHLSIPMARLKPRPSKTALVQNQRRSKPKPSEPGILRTKVHQNETPLGEFLEFQRFSVQ
jgi:hypothetical protein